MARRFSLPSSLREPAEQSTPLSIKCWGFKKYTKKSTKRQRTTNRVAIRQPVDYSVSFPSDFDDYGGSEAENDENVDRANLPPGKLAPDAVPLDCKNYPLENSYFEALQQAKSSSAVVFLPRGWILVQDFAVCGAPPIRNYRLARARYALISATKSGLGCSCDVKNCLHTAYVLRWVQDSVDSEAPAGSLSSSLDSISFPTHDFNTEPHFVTVIRDYGLNSRVRRLFAVMLNPISSPVIVSQNNKRDSPWTCRQCTPELGCAHMTAAIRYCLKHHSDENPMGAIDYRSDRKERKLNARISFRPIPPPFSISTRYPVDAEKDNELDDSSFRLRTKSELEIYESVIRARFPILLMERRCSNKSCEGLPPQLSIQPGSTRDGKLFLSSAIYNVLVSSCVCMRCNTVTPYDGLDDGIFNYNNEFLFSHYLLNSFTSRFANHPCPFTAFVATQLMDYENCGVTPGAFITVPTFIKVWFSFVQLQRWKFEFCCPDCGSRPRMVFCDGTGLSIKLTQSKTLRPPTWIDPETPNRLPTVVDWSELVAFRKKEIRTALDQILPLMRAAGRLSSGLRVSEREDRLREAKEILDNIAGKPESWPLFKELYNLLIVDSFPFFTQWMESAPEKVDALCFIVQYLSKEESLMSLLPPFVFDLCSKVINYRWSVPERLRNGMLAARPMLYDIFHAFSLFNGSDYRKPEQRQLVEFIQALLLKAQSIIRQFDSVQAQADRTPRPLLPVEITQLSDYERLKSAKTTSEFTGKYYGKLKRQRVMQRYEGLDAPPAAEAEFPPASQASYSGPKASKEPAACSSDRYFEKAGKRKRKFTGGIMAFWCEHGVCLGFHMMSGAGESPADVMRAILTYWEKAPEVIVYDRACELMHYCHRREWEFFKNTTFLIDEFHTYGHTKCTKCHAMRSFKQSRTRLFLFKNCSISESCNLGLKKIRTSCYFCAAPTAFLMTISHLELHNVRKIHALQCRAENRSSAMADVEEQLDKQLMRVQLHDEEEYPGAVSMELDSDSDYDG
jgi:hypothetical protein